MVRCGKVRYESDMGFLGKQTALFVREQVCLVRFDMRLNRLILWAPRYRAR